MVQKGEKPPAAPPALEEWHRKSTVRFLLVHGMGNHPFGIKKDGTPQLFGHGSYEELNREFANWNTISDARRTDIAKAAMKTQFDGFIEAYSRRAGLTETTEREPLGFEIIKSSDGRVLGYLFRREFQPAGASGQPAVFYVACWALSAAQAKEEVYGSWDGHTVTGKVGDFSPAIDAPRSSLNRMLKHGTVNWGLTDASIYVSPKGREFEGTVSVAMQKMSADLGTDDRVVFVTASLGSTITYNALTKLMEQRRAGGSWRASRSAPNRLRRLFFKREGEEDTARVAFYMFANQYGLLMAGAEELPSAAEVRKLTQAPSVSLDRAVQAAQEDPPPADQKRRFSPRAVQLVAFTDPDDLLSYGVPERKSGKRGSVAITNVFVRNNGLKFIIPVAGSVTNPLQAHGGYGENPAVLQTMLKGVR